MKYAILCLLGILWFFGCKPKTTVQSTIAETVQGTMLETDQGTTAETVQNTTAERGNNDQRANKCTMDIAQLNGIPKPLFYTKKKGADKQYLIDSVFGKDFFLYNLDGPRVRDGIEFNAGLELSDLPGFWINNRYRFYTPNDHVAYLQSVDLTFPSSHYKKVYDSDLLKIKHRDTLIDIGMDKGQFALLFDKKAENLCDTIRVSSETSSSWYIFKKEALVGVIFQLYTE